MCASVGSRSFRVAPPGRCSHVKQALVFLPQQNQLSLSKPWAVQMSDCPVYRAIVPVLRGRCLWHAYDSAETVP